MGEEVLAFAGMAAAAVGGLVLGRPTSDAGFQKELRQVRAERDEALVRVYTDHLTRLPNRAAFLEALDRRAAAGERYTIAMLDLDDFKAINDHLGHATGDSMLYELGVRLAELASGGAAMAARL